VNPEVFITCAVTGAGATADKSELVPVKPGQIADAAIEAARAGAAVVHIHVRDPATSRGARDPALYREVVERIRSSDVDAVLNLSAGMGGDLVLGGDETPLPSTRTGPTWRVPPSGSRTSKSSCPRSARSTAAA
jgi:uncharacterized protein (DUF849 family)